MNRKLVTGKELFLNVLFGSIFGICVILSGFIVSSYVAIFAYAIYIVYIVATGKEFFVKYLSIFFSAIFTTLGAAIIELGSKLYLVELRTYSGFAGSLPLLIFTYWVLLFTVIVVDRRFETKVNIDRIAELGKSAKKIDKITIIVFALFAILFASIVDTPPAMLSGIDRFVYQTQYQTSGLLETLSNISYMLIIFPILSVIYGNKFLGIVSLALYILYYLWIGNKFGPFFTLVCIFMLVYYRKLKDMNRKQLKKLVLITAIAFAAIVAFAVFFSVSIGSDDPFTYIEERGAQQGQLWWKTYNLCNEIHITEFGDEIEAFSNGKNSVVDNVGSSNGIYKIMYYCAPKSVVDAKLLTGSRYTEGGFAIVYYYFGSIGLILYVMLMGIIFSYTINAFIRHLNKGNYIGAMIWLRFFSFERGFLSMFLFKDFFDVITLLSFVYLIFMRNRKITFQ